MLSVTPSFCLFTAEMLVPLLGLDHEVASRKLANPINILNVFIIQPPVMSRFKIGQ